mmetsp:Transcript_24638/g.84333  ORF Transcript_24638/g.84333 Transcript_24638/m.84333 type:complete len:299 (-) Transcript_24638:280-1176(-)
MDRMHLRTQTSWRSGRKPFKFGKRLRNAWQTSFGGSAAASSPTAARMLAMSSRLFWHLRQSTDAMGSSQTWSSSSSSYRTPRCSSPSRPERASALTCSSSARRIAAAFCSSETICRADAKSKCSCAAFERMIRTSPSRMGTRPAAALRGRSWASSKRASSSSACVWPCLFFNAARDATSELPCISLTTPRKQRSVSPIFEAADSESVSKSRCFDNSACCLAKRSATSLSCFSRRALFEVESSCSSLRRCSRVAPSAETAASRRRKESAWRRCRRWKMVPYRLRIASRRRPCSRQPTVT